MKSLDNQETELSAEINKVSNALEAFNTNDESLIRQKYIDAAVRAWKSKGTAVHYLDSLTELTDKDKSEILISAALRHKGRLPKNNPYK